MTPLLDPDAWDDLAQMLDTDALSDLATRALDDAQSALVSPLSVAVVHKAAGGAAVIGAAALHAALAALEQRLKAGDGTDHAERAALDVLARTRAEVATRLAS